MTTRRQFLTRLPPLLSGAAALSSCRALGTLLPEASMVMPGFRIDGLGEIRLDYEGPLLDQIRASGLHGCVITVGNPALQGSSAFASVTDEMAAYDRHIRANPSRLARAREIADLRYASAGGHIGLIYYSQNATPIEDDPGRLDTLKRLGLRIMQLTYNYRNLVGDGCLEPGNAGLSRFGLDVVAAMNDRRLLVDLSHCGEATTLDAITHSRLPVAITHSGCRAVFQHPRNKSDQVLRQLAARGGVIGIYQINPYLGPRERNTLDDYLRHIDHAIQVCGIDHVGIGSDREHRTIPDTAAERRKLEEELGRLGPAARSAVRWPFFLSELNHPRRMDTLAEALARRGRSHLEIEKLLGGNFFRLFRDTIG